MKIMKLVEHTHTDTQAYIVQQRAFVVDGECNLTSHKHTRLHLHVDNALSFESTNITSGNGILPENYITHLEHAFALSLLLLLLYCAPERQTFEIRLFSLVPTNFLEKQTTHTMGKFAVK